MHFSIASASARRADRSNPAVRSIRFGEPNCHRVQVKMEGILNRRLRHWFASRRYHRNAARFLPPWRRGRSHALGLRQGHHSPQRGCGVDGVRRPRLVAQADACRYISGMSTKQITNRMGLPDRVVTRAERLLSRAWMCSNCGDLTKSDEPVPVPPPCAKCGRILFESVDPPSK